jgi:hypothetical protein
MNMAMANYRLTISAMITILESRFNCCTNQTMFAEFPDSRPVMVVMNTSYREGELLSVNCTTQPSKTSPNLTFYINNRAVSK